MRMLLHLSSLVLGAAYIWGAAMEDRMSTLVRETLTLLSTHRALLIGNEHQLCVEEIFQGIDMLKNQTAPGDAVRKLFQNLSLIKKYIDLQKEKCGEERRRAKQFLDYVEEFLGVISTEWTMESWD